MTVVVRRHHYDTVWTPHRADWRFNPVPVNTGQRTNPGLSVSAIWTCDSHYIHHKLSHSSHTNADRDQTVRARDGGRPPRERTNAEKLLSFLAAHDEQAFTPEELHEATDVARGSVDVILSRLEDRGLVRHRGEYWAIAEDADIETTLTSLATSRTATDRFGAEDPDEWGPRMSDEAGQDL